MQRQLGQYVSFSKKEFNGIVVLCSLITLVLIFPWLYAFWLDTRTRESVDVTDFEQKAVDFYVNNQFNKSLEDTNFDDKLLSKRILKPCSLFFFNPNTLSDEGWGKLGLTDRQIKTIRKYQSRGGRFYDKDDVSKIYGISPALYKQWMPYVVIPPVIRQKMENMKLKKDLAKVELNGADSLLLLTIRGVGPAFAHRILRYRNRLGGFYAKEQLKEIWGLDSAKYVVIEPQVLVNAQLIKKIKVNNASVADLRVLPYLTYRQIYAILNYAKQHGTFKSIVDMKSIVLLNDEILGKIEPYLSFE